MVYTLAALMLGGAGAARATLPADSSSAVVFMYQRVDDDALPQSSISLDQFQEHLRELKAGEYIVMSIPDMIATIQSGQPLPHKAVAITFDGAWLSTLNTALPLLDAENYPYTVFFSSDLADSNAPGHMTWQQLTALRNRKNATLGIQPSIYAHLTDIPAEKSAEYVNKAVGRYREVFGVAPDFFSWPYGEYTLPLKQQIASYNFKAAFAQQSGVVSPQADMMALPRFTMSDLYGDLDRFRLTANALPLPVTEVTPDDPLLTQNPPMIGFTVPPEVGNLSRLSCFISGIGKVDLRRLEGNRVEIRPTAPFQDRRTRVNCTIPDATIIPGEPQYWRWLGLLYIDPANTADDGANEESGGLE